MERRLAEGRATNNQITTDYFNYKHAIAQSKNRLSEQIVAEKHENEVLRNQVGAQGQTKNSDGIKSEKLYAEKTK